MPLTTLTAKQAEVLALIAATIVPDGAPCTIRAIQAILRARHINAVHVHIRALRKKGWLLATSRFLVLTQEGWREPACRASLLAYLQRVARLALPAVMAKRRPLLAEGAGLTREEIRAAQAATQDQVS